MRYIKIENGVVEQAPRGYRDGDMILPATHERNIAHGYLPEIVSEPSEAPESGMRWVGTGEYERVGDEYRLVYRQEAIQYTQDDYDRVMEDHIRRSREDRGYTTREPTAYAMSSNPRWRQDALDWAAFQDAVMWYGLGVINSVAAGNQPPTMEEFKAGLPQVEWTYREGGDAS